jgi:hypothetical protein
MRPDPRPKNRMVGFSSSHFRKLVAGRKLWNFQRSGLHIWKAAL